jgi:hypothetical protein
MRPGCDRPAVTRLSYDTVSCRVWLDPLPDRQGPAQEICSLHSSRLTVPRGWMLCDRRDAPDVAEVAPRRSAAAPIVVAVPMSVDDSEDRTDVPAETAESSAPVGAAEQTSRPATRRVARTTPVAASDPQHDAVIESVPAEPAVQAVESGDTPDTGSGDAEVSEEPIDDEDLPELLRASSPLLSRAFRATGPQRSVLTQSLYDESD